MYHPGHEKEGVFFVTLDGGGNREDPNYFPGQKVETLYECQFATPEEVALQQQQQTQQQQAVSVLAAPAAAPAASVAQGPGLNGEPLRSTYLGRHIGTVHTMSLSLSGKYLMLGTRNGGCQLRALDDLEYFFYTHFHDGSGGSTGSGTGAAGHASAGADAKSQRSGVSDRIGVVSGVTTTFDDRFLLSVGHDGNFFAYSIDPESALSHMDRSVELAVATERRQAEEARLAKIRAKEEAAEAARKEEEERVAREAASANRKDARTREQKDREARELKEKEQRDRDAKEKHERERDARLKAREESKNDKERDDDNFEHLAVRVPDRSLTVLPLPDASLAQEKLEPRLSGSAAVGAAQLAAEDDALDITDPRSYSIEEAKLKQEEDDRVAAAEKKKQRMRLEIA